jgi:hypothetical protein
MEELIALVANTALERRAVCVGVAAGFTDRHAYRTGHIVAAGAPAADFPADDFARVVATLLADALVAGAADGSGSRSTADISIHAVRRRLT